jgi:hypothetical protein
MQPEIAIELNHLAIVIALVLVFAFIIGLHPFKKKRRLVLAATIDHNIWMAGDYYMYLNSLIRASKALEELQQTMPLIEAYYDKEFRVPISKAVRKDYYARLLQSYCDMEIKFGKIPVILCKN